MQPNEPAHDGEAEPGALISAVIGALGLEEGVAQARQVGGGDADPVSDTDRSIMSPSRTTASTTRPPGGVNLIALESRLIITCLSARRSPCTSGKSGPSTRSSRISPASARRFISARQSRAISERSSGSWSIVIVPLSILEMSSSVLTTSSR